MQTEFVCIRECLHGRPADDRGVRPPRRRYAVGDSVWFDPDREAVPRHFVLKIEHAPGPVPDTSQVLLKPVQGLKAPVNPDKLAAINAAKASKKAAKGGEK